MGTVNRKTFLKAASAGAILPAVVGVPTLASAASERRAPTIMLRDTTTVTYWNYTEVAGPTSEQALVDYYNTHIGPSKGIHIDLTVFPINSFEEKVDTALAAGDAGDIIFTSPVEMYARIKRGWFTNLTPLIKKNINMGLYFPQTLPYLQFPPSSGAVYGLPRDWVVSNIVYNKDMFDKAGMAYPNDSWTWNDLRAAALKLTKSEGGRTTQWGFAGIGNAENSQAMQTLSSIIWSNGGRLIAPGNKQSLINTPSVVSSLQFVTDMIRKDKSTPPPTSFTGNLDPFTAGLAAMSGGGSWLMATWQDTIGSRFRWDCAPYPKGTHGRACYGGPDTLAMSSTAKNPQAVFEAMMFLTGTPPSPQLTAWFAQRLGFLPFPKAMWSSPSLVTTSKILPNYRKVMMESADVLRAEYTIGYSEWQTDLQQVLDKAWLGQISPAQAAAQGQKVVDQVLAKWYS